MADTRIPQVTRQLHDLGKQTLAHETNLTRAPLWGPRETRSTQLDLLLPAALYGQNFEIISGKPLTVADQRMYAGWCTEWVRSGCPSDLAVSFSLTEGAQLLGYAVSDVGQIGGQQRKLIRESLRRIRAVGLRWHIRHPDGQESEGEFGLIGDWRTTSRGGGRGSITLTRAVADLLRSGSLTYLRASVWDAMRADDEVAARLWTFLEAEDGLEHQPRSYHLFAGPEGGVVFERNLPAVADLLCLHASTRRNVAGRIRRAAEAVERHDSRYRVSVGVGRGRGMWVLRARRVMPTVSPVQQAE